jgi:neutral ceramidase
MARRRSAETMVADETWLDSGDEVGTKLKAGSARVVITPPVGTPMSGFAGRAVSSGVHDDLTATALVLVADAGVGSAGEPLVLICCDLLSLSGSRVDAIRGRITASTGISGARILISSSHNHYGPVTEVAGEALASVPGPQVAPYMENLANQLAGLVQMALSDLIECRLSVGEGQVVIGINRRERTESGIILGQNPGGPLEPRLSLLRVDTLEGRPLAAVLNYACHAVSLGAECTQYTADFPSVARRVVEQETGALCLYLQGAAGDVNPLLMGMDWSHPVRLGLPVGAEAVRVFWTARPVEALPSGIASTTQVLRLPPSLPPSEAAAVAQLAELEQELAGADAEERSADAHWARARIRALDNGLKVLRGHAAPQHVQAEVTAVALAQDVGLVTAPGEIFTEIGRNIVERSPFAHTLYSGYTNGSIDYVPTRAAYAEGGYEVTHGCRVAPEGGELLEEESVRLLEAVHDGAMERSVPIA